MKKEKRDKRPKISEDRILSGSLTEENLESITGGHQELCDYYDSYRCYTPIPNSRCHIREPNARCKYLSMEQLSSGKYRYVCAKGCFDYSSDNKLH